MTLKAALKSKTAIMTDIDSTMQTDVNSLSARVSPETFSSDRTPDDLNSVCVKVETDEWNNMANVFLLSRAQSKQAIREEKHQDHIKQDGFNFAHEKSQQKGCEVKDQDLTKQDGFNLASVKFDQTESENMHQDDIRQDGINLASVKLEQTECEDVHQYDIGQAGFNSVCVNRKQTADSNVYLYTEQNGLISVFWKPKHSVNPNADQSCLTTNGLIPVCGKVNEYINTNINKGRTTKNDHNSACEIRAHIDILNTLEDHAEQADLNSEFVTRDQIELSNVDHNYARPTIVNSVVGKTLKADHDCILYIQMDSNCEKDESDDSGGQAKKRKTNLKSSIIKPSAAPASTTSSKPSTVPKPKLGPLSFISRGPLTIKSRNDLNADRIPQRWREVCVRLNRKDVPEGLQPHEVVFVNSAPSPVAKVSIEMPDDLVGDDDVNDFDSEDEYVDSDNDPVWKPGSVASTNSEIMSETANRSKPLVCKDRNLDMLLEKDVEWEHFFTKQELDKMTFHQQRRLKNITQNYKIMYSMGLPAIKPDFMTGPVYRAEVAKAEEGSDAHSGIVCVDSNFDEECAQDLERTEQAQENAVKRTVPHFLQTAKRNMEEKDDKMKKVKRIKVTKTTGEDKTECSLLERSQVSCMNLEPPKNDHLLYCEECKDEFEGDCSVHGPYNYIQDKEVMKGDPLRADHTLPDCLEIKTSKIVTAGVGVFTKEGLESRIMFGPYCGDIITGKQAVLKTRYCWQIYTESKPSHFVDAQNKAASNWMRYVNCATTEADQNLVALQYKGGIYYCTFKPVLPGEELLVWYGDECARELGLIRDKNLLF